MMYKAIIPLVTMATIVYALSKYHNRPFLHELGYVTSKTGTLILKGCMWLFDMNTKDEGDTLPICLHTDGFGNVDYDAFNKIFDPLKSYAEHISCSADDTWNGCYRYFIRVDNIDKNIPVEKFESMMVSCVAKELSKQMANKGINGKFSKTSMTHCRILSNQAILMVAYCQEGMEFVTQAKKQLRETRANINED